MTKLGERIELDSLGRGLHAVLRRGWLVRKKNGHRKETGELNAILGICLGITVNSIPLLHCLKYGERWSDDELFVDGNSNSLGRGEQCRTSITIRVWDW